VAWFRQMLVEEEKCAATIEKYLHDLRTFLEYLGEETAVTKETVIRYKQQLIERQYAATTVNASLVSLNSFFKRMGWYDCIVKLLKIQREAFRSQERELSRDEYLRLLKTAKSCGNVRLYFVIETLGSTGIRISELKYITVEAVRQGHTHVALKGKNRTILIPEALCRELRRYAKSRGIQSGSIFITRNGKPLNRCYVFREMKKLCGDAGVNPKKVFPHNLRHLFACMYYKVEKDIARLADILGHSSIDTTRIYLRRSYKEQEKQINRLGLVRPLEGFRLCALT
jgi:site-specific recombinase XerD